MAIKKIILPNKEVRWEVVTRPLGKNSKQIKRRFEKKIDAQEFVDSIKQRRNATLNCGPAKVQFDIEGTTFNVEADYWLSSMQGDFTAGYMRVINPGLKKIRERYGHYPIAHFSPALLLEFRKFLRSEGLSSSTQNRYTDLIIRVINFSFVHKRINANPCQGYEKGNEIYEEMEFWDIDEVQAFLSYANRKYPRGSEKRWIYCAYLFALETGVRARELWGIKLKDLPKSEAKIKISRQSLGGIKFEPTKGKDSRYVPFSSGLRDEIESSLKNELEELKPERTLFVSTVGTPIDHDNFADRVFKKDVEECGLRKIRFHDLRHTAITLMVKAKINLPTIQKIAGHKDLKTTMRYVHILGKDIEDVGSQHGLMVREEQAKLLKLV